MEKVFFLRKVELLENIKNIHYLSYDARRSGWNFLCSIKTNTVGRFGYFVLECLCRIADIHQKE